MLKKVLTVVAVLLLILIGVIASRPDTYHVERSITIAAPAELVYAQVTDFHAWQAWSPWEKLDPNMKRSFEGPAQGAGSSYAWQGNDDVGSGKMTIVEALPPSSMTMRLEFIEPFASVASNGFKLVPAGQGVKTTWWMDGQNDFMGKAFGLFLDMDKLIGADFERGLANLERVSEAEAAKRASELQAAETAARAAGAAAQATATPETAPPAQR